jgi:hypothetical protein
MNAPKKEAAMTLQELGIIAVFNFPPTVPPGLLIFLSGGTAGPGN